MSEQTTKFVTLGSLNVIDRRRIALSDDDAMKTAFIALKILRFKGVHICKMEISTRFEKDHWRGEIAPSTKVWISVEITGGDISGLCNMVTDLPEWDLKYSQFSVKTMGHMHTSAQFDLSQGVIPDHDKIDENIMKLYKMLRKEIKKE